MSEHHPHCRRETALQLKNRIFRPLVSFNLKVVDTALQVAAATARCTVERKPSGLCEIPPQPPLLLRSGDFLEIHGPTATGKSVLLEAVVARTVLPEWFYSPFADDDETRSRKRRRSPKPIDSEYSGRNCREPLEGLDSPAETTRRIRVAGQGKRALVIDMSPRGFDLERMERQCAACLYSALSRATENTVYRQWEDALQATVDESTRRVHVLRVESSEALLAHLARLPTLLADLPSPGIGLLAVDEPGAFYWEDHVHEHTIGEVRRAAWTGNRAAADSRVFVAETAATLGRALKSMAGQLGAVIVAATGSIWDPPGKPPPGTECKSRDSQASRGCDEFFFRDHMPQTGWQDLVTHRLVTGKPPPRNKVDSPPDESELATAYARRLRGSGKCTFWVATCGMREVDGEWANRMAASRSCKGEEGGGSGWWFEFDVTEYGVALGS